MSVWTLTPTELAVLCDADGFDRLPYPLFANLDDVDPDERDAVNDAAEAHLLTTMTEARAAAIDTLNRPSHRISVVAFPLNNRKRGVRIASGFRDGNAVIASQSTAPDDPWAHRGGSVSITSTDLAGWITALVSALPPREPGRLPPVPNMTSTDEPDSVLINATPDPVDRARHILLTAPTDLLGEFILEELDVQDTTVLSRATVAIGDITGDGRYAAYGRKTKSSTPVTAKQLTRLLTQVVSDLKYHRKV